MLLCVQAAAFSAVDLSGGPSVTVVDNSPGKQSALWFMSVHTPKSDTGSTAYSVFKNSSAEVPYLHVFGPSMQQMQAAVSAQRCNISIILSDIKDVPRRPAITGGVPWRRNRFNTYSATGLPRLLPLARGRCRIKPTTGAGDAS